MSAPGQLLYQLLNSETDPVSSNLGAHVLANAMLHIDGWWGPHYSRSPLIEFFATTYCRNCGQPLAQVFGRIWHHPTGFLSCNPLYPAGPHAEPDL